MNKAATVAWAALGLTAASAAAAQGGPDELWNMSTRMEAAGMQMPGQTQQVCMKKGETRAESLSQDKNCRVTEQKRAGNKMTWKMVCTGKDAMSGSGEITRTASTMDGRMQMKTKDGDEMTLVYSGKLAGGCNAEDQGKQAKAMVAQGEAASAQVCSEAMDKYQTMLFEMQGAPCAPKKAEYCGRVKQVSQSMRTPAGYRAAMKNEGLRGEGWAKTAKYCGVQTAPVMAEACKSAVGGRDWPFVADHCPAEAKKIAAEHCAGRDYTAAMASEYKDVCRRYASRGAAASSDSEKPSAAPGASGTVKGGVEEGTRALKKLFGR